MTRDTRSGFVIDDERVKGRLKEMFDKAIEIDKLPHLTRLISRFMEDTVPYGDRRPMRHLFYLDSAPLSLFWVEQVFDFESMDWKRGMVGGLIWHEHSQEWGSHT